MRRLVWAFAGRTYHIVGNLMSWLKSCLWNSISDILVGNKQKPKRIYSCCYCVKVFDRPAKLTEHKRVHTREKPYSCDICDYRSTLKGNLKRHYLIHVKTADIWNGSSYYVNLILWIIFCPELPAFYEAQAQLTGHWPQGYKTFSLLNPAEYEIWAWKMFYNPWAWSLQ